MSQGPHRQRARARARAPVRAARLKAVVETYAKDVPHRVYGSDAPHDDPDYNSYTIVEVPASARGIIAGRARSVVPRSV